MSLQRYQRCYYWEFYGPVTSTSNECDVALVQKLVKGADQSFYKKIRRVLG